MVHFLNAAAAAVGIIVHAFLFAAAGVIAPGYAHEEFSATPFLELAARNGNGRGAFNNRAVR